MLHQKNVFSCRVYGKLLLCGEHVALCGAGAAGVPVLQNLTLHFQAHDGAFACISQLVVPDGSSNELSMNNAFFSFVNDICKAHALPVLGQTLNGTITIRSSIPLGCGLGSSAALCCAIAQLILHYQKDENYHIDYQRRVWHLAHRFEQFFHVRASGIDTALCTYGVPLVLSPAQIDHAHEDVYAPPQFRISPISCEILTQLHLVYGSISREASCAKIIHMVQKNLCMSDNARVLKRDTIQVLRFLQNAQVNELHAVLAPILTRIHTHLVQLGASTPTMEVIIACAYDSGACAAKLSGAGAGGSFVCLCKSNKNAHHVSAMLMKKLTASFSPHTCKTYVVSFGKTL